MPYYLILALAAIVFYVLLFFAAKNWHWLDITALALMFPALQRSGQAAGNDDGECNSLNDNPRRRGATRGPGSGYGCIDSDGR